ncbi:hypothetical protein ABBQ38_013848 [Trebouxia sp. C0009 RCD-2024]
MFETDELEQDQMEEQGFFSARPAALPPSIATWLQLLPSMANTSNTVYISLTCNTSNTTSVLQALFEAVVSGEGINIAEVLTIYTLAGIYKSLKGMGMAPAAEFTTALVEGASLDARLICGDQEQSVTIKNIAKSLSIMDALKLLTASGIKLDPEMREKFDQNDLTGTVEALKTRRTAQLLIKALRKFNPKLAKALIDDRDEYMVRGLRRLEGRIVGVVGIGHLDGMERRWQQLGGERLDL